MNERIQDLWVAALRSGEYKQGFRRLKDGDAYCCLGVLCDLHAKETSGKWYRELYHHGRESYYGAEGLLPQIVSQWAGVSECPCSQNRALVGMNDAGMSFEQIADEIEKGMS